jgi:hypothetical protein
MYRIWEMIFEDRPIPDGPQGKHVNFFFMSSNHVDLLRATTLVFFIEREAGV